MTPFTATSETTPPGGNTPPGGTTPEEEWQDIDAELRCSAREVCFGYSGLIPADVMAALRSSARPWAEGDETEGGAVGEPVRSGRNGADTG